MNPLFDKLDKLGLRPFGDPNERLSVTQADVEDVERLFGFPFPPLYSEFLLRYGASGFYDGFASFDVPDDWDERTDGAPTDVWAFFGLDDDREYGGWNLAGEIRSARQDGLPSHFLPICSSDGLATIVYLSCREQDYGHAYALARTQIWDVMEGELSTEEACRAAFHVADSFEDFLERLHVVPREELDASADMEPLFVALHAGDVSFLQSMVDAGEIETYRSENGLTLLESAITSRLSWPVEFLLKHTAPTGRDLWIAVQNGCVDAIRLLIAHGVDVNAPNPLDRVSTEWHTPLIQAVRSDLYDKKYEMARLLVEAGADVGLRDSQGKTALDYVHPRNQKMRDILARKS